MINKNKLFRQVHIYLSLFFLPCALLFALTGIVYIFGINQDVGLKVEQYQLSKVIESGKEREALIEFLKTNGLKVPSNTNIIKSNTKTYTKHRKIPSTLIFMKHNHISKQRSCF